MGEQEWFNQDFYKLLGVDKDADDKEIKKAYRKLARKWHPDQNPGDAKAEEQFKKISEAFSVLSDAEQRERYDAIRQMAAGGARFAPGTGGGGGFEDMFGGMFNAGAAPGGFGGSGGQYYQSAGGGGGFEDILSNLFGGAGGSSGFNGGGFGGGYAPPPQPQQGADLKASTKISFKEAYTGTSMRVTIGGKPVTVKIPAGVRDGQKIKIRGKGQPGVNGGPAGNLVVEVAVEKNKTYTAEGANLRVKLPVSFSEAVLGAQVEVPLPDGTSVKMKVPAGTSSGKVLRLRGKGLQKSGKRGDLLVDLMIVLPPRIDQQVKDAAQALQQAEADWNPRADLGH